SNRQPVVGDGIGGDEPAIKANGFAIKGIGEGFIGSGGVAQRSGGNCDTAKEVFIELAIKPEPDANTGAITVLRAGLSVVFAAYPNVTGKAKSPQQTFDALELRKLRFRAGFEQGSFRGRCR